MNAQLASEKGVGRVANGTYTGATVTPAEDEYPSSTISDAPSGIVIEVSEVETEV